MRINTCQEAIVICRNIKLFFGNRNTIDRNETSLINFHITLTLRLDKYKVWNSLSEEAIGILKIQGNMIYFNNVIGTSKH